MNPILLAVLLVSAVGLFCAVVLVIAAHFMAVKKFKYLFCFILGNNISYADLLTAVHRNIRNHISYGEAYNIILAFYTGKLDLLHIFYNSGTMHGMHNFISDTIHALPLLFPEYVRHWTDPQSIILL